MKTGKLAIPCISALFLLLSLCAEAVEYRIVDLGTMDGLESYATDINNHGQVVGSATYHNTNLERAFLWKEGSPMTDLGSLGGTWGKAYGINDSGQVVGASATSSGQYHAFLWQNGTPMRDLGIGTATGSTYSYARAINNGGMTVGGGNREGGDNAFVWPLSGSMRVLGTFGGSDSHAFGVNDAGQVVGRSRIANPNANHPFLWQAGSSMQDLGTLGGTTGIAMSINNAGQVTGNAATIDGSTHAFLWQSGIPMRDLGTLGGFASDGRGINDSGVVVGLSYLPGNGSYHAFVWTSESGMQDLGTLGGANSQAYAINSSGWIVGCAQNALGLNHAVLWQPVPEPSSILVLLAGVAGAGGMAVRRRK